jgi:hypothetical protein
MFRPCCGSGGAHSLHTACSPLPVHCLPLRCSTSPGPGALSCLLFGCSAEARHGALGEAAGVLGTPWAGEERALLTVGRKQVDGGRYILLQNS